MDNFQTIEVRWFYRGEMPVQIGNWFETVGRQLEKIDSRSDVYLQSNSPDVGMKLRQGNLEVKYRQAEIGRFEIDGLVNSCVERWSKWICVDDSGHLTPTQFADRPGWLKVDKIRDRRLFRVEFGERVKLIQVATPTADLAAIELTRLQVFDQNWWTIACEYFGNDLEIDRQFLPLVSKLLAESKLADITPQISCGYPQWSIEIGRDYN
jgi:hypothetical protein